MDAVLHTMSDVKSNLNRLSDRLANVPVVEERTVRIKEDLDHACNRLQRLEDSLETYKEEQRGINDRYNKWLYGMAGAVGVFSVAWTVFGGLLTQLVAQLIKHHDKVTGVMP